MTGALSPSFTRLKEAFASRIDRWAIAVLIVGFLARLATALTFYLNPDEAYHALLANASGFWDLYESAARSPHPPLFVMSLHYVQQLSRSDIALRMLPILCGSLAPWVVYRWVGRGWGKRAGFIALLILAVTPDLVFVNSEARAYGLLLLFMASALYFLDTAIEMSSPWRMAAFSLSLYLAILTEYSAAWFALAVGIYFLLRIREPTVTGNVRIVWELGQMGAGFLYMLLYVTQLRLLFHPATPRPDVQDWLRQAYLQPGENPLSFTIWGTARQFHYLLPNLFPAVAAILVFLVAVVLLWRNRSPENPGWSRSKAVLLLLPFAISCAGAFVHLHPYGRSRHTVFLSLFIATGLGIGLDRLMRLPVARGLWAWARRHRLLLAGAIVLAVPTLYSGWFVLSALRYDSCILLAYRRDYMADAVRFLRASVPPGSLILTESETRVVLAPYLGDTEWLPELHEVPTEEPINGYRMFAGHWSYQNPGEFYADLELMRQTYSLDPAELVWVIDAGFTVGVRSLFEETNETEDRPRAHWFGNNILMFQIPAGAASQRMGSGETGDADQHPQADQGQPLL